MLGVGNTTGETAMETGYSHEIFVRTKKTLQLGQHSTTQRACFLDSVEKRSDDRRSGINE